jgi:hypothetical protein
MGVYLNVEDQSKEMWLQKNAMQINATEAKEHEDYKDLMLIVLVQNMMFSAAAIAYKQEEKVHFLDPQDRRPKRFYLIEREKLPEHVQQQLTAYQK